MTTALGLSGVLGDVVILLLLVTAVAATPLSQAARPLIATFAFVSAWLLTAVLDALRAPAWTTLTGGAVTVVSVVVVIVTLHRWTQGGDRDESGAGQQGDHGGGGPGRRRPDAPQTGGGDGDPSWWPEFERQLAAYVAERETETPHQHAARAKTFRLLG